MDTQQSTNLPLGFDMIKKTKLVWYGFKKNKRVKIKKIACLSTHSWAMLT
jgi:hypothetical protein